MGSDDEVWVNYSDFYVNQKFTDLNLYCRLPNTSGNVLDSEPIKAHRLVLASVSSNFKATLLSIMATEK